MCSSINIQFDDLSYSVHTIFSRGRRKEILKNISGEFQTSQLTAILGPSGSGKSTLLNALSGFQKKNIKGRIEINGGNINEFRKSIVYIMQDNHLQSQLTVSESMNFAIKLKTGNAMSTHAKWKKIDSILEQFGLAGVESVFVKNLSGGQQKRLAIAVEIVDNPTLIFLDEPTTGLDSSSSTNCINVMKELARKGKTVICTIHQPSGNQLKMFDHLYALANGECVYQGSPKNLVPFLAEIDFLCPIFYNSADYLLEVVTGVYGEENHRLVEKIENGKNDNYRAPTTPVYDDASLDLTTSSYSPSFASQFYDLLVRNFVIMFRDKTFTYLRMLMHILVGLLLGAIYYDIGDDAQHILNIFRLIFVALSFLTYTSYYSLMVVFPINFASIQREVFNRWYCSTKFFFALVISDIPIIIIGNILFIVPVYYFTSQPFELFRICNFVLVMMINSFTSQAFGLIAGAFWNLKGTLILAPTLMCIHGVFAGFYILKKDSHPFWHPFYETSYLKFSAYAAEISILGFNRTKMECHSFYCHFSHPQKFLQTVGFDEDFMKCIWILLLNFAVFIVIAYFIIRYRLKRN